MNTPGFRLDRRRLLLAAAAAVPAGCAAPQYAAQPAAVAPVLPRVGQRWRYAEVDLYRGEKRAELLAEVVESTPARLRVALTHTDAGRRDDEIYAGPAHLVQEPAYDLTLVFEEPIPFVPPQLMAGTGGKSAVYYHTPESPDFRLWWGDWMRAPGWQRVRVPAGEFLALRIDRVIRFDHADLWREDSRRFDTAWYAPEVGRWVLREWTGEYTMPSGPDKTRVYESRVRWELLDWRRA